MTNRVQNEPNEQNQQNQQLQAKVDVLTQVLDRFFRFLRKFFNMMFVLLRHVLIIHFHVSLSSIHETAERINSSLSYYLVYSRYTRSPRGRYLGIPALSLP